jgi:hypothetical protein
VVEIGRDPLRGGEGWGQGEVEDKPSQGNCSETYAEGPDGPPKTRQRTCVTFRPFLEIKTFFFISAARTRFVNQ